MQESNRSSWICWLAVVGFIFGTSAVWALSTPLMGSPDEPAHVIRAVSIWEGDIGKGKVTVEGALVIVEAHAPEIIAESHGLPTCWAFQPNQVPSCAPAFTGSTRVVTTSTSSGLHPPLFYAMVGWAGRLFPSATGVYLMRLVGALACALLIGSAAWSIIERRQGPLTLVATLVGFTPVAAFLSGTVNPNGFEIAAAIAMWVHGLAFVTERAAGNKPPTRVAVQLAGSASLLALTRPLSPGFVVIIALLLCGTARQNPFRLVRDRQGLATFSVILSSLMVAVAWTIHSGLLTTELESTPPSTNSVFEATFGSVSGYFQQMVGAFSWLDAGISSVTVISWLLIVAGLLMLGQVLGERRAIAWTWLTLLAGAMLPVAAQWSSYSTNGLVWQGRYSLPLLAGVPILAAHSISLGRLRAADQRRIANYVALLMAIGYIGGYSWAMKRWTVGVSGPSWWIDSARWRPNTPGPLWLLPAALVAVTVVGLTTIVRTAPGPIDATLDN